MVLSGSILAMIMYSLLIRTHESHVIIAEQEVKQFFLKLFHFQDGIKNSSGKNSQQTRGQDGRSLRPDSFAAAVNTAPRVSATYVKSSRNGRTISGSREVTV